MKHTHPRILACGLLTFAFENAQHFAPNPFFSNDVIIKSFRFVEDGLESQAFHIDWAPVCALKLSILHLDLSTMFITLHET